MSKERQRRREARDREAGIVAAARAAQAEKRERRDARKGALTSRFPRRHSRQTGVLAQRRRKQTGATIALLIALNVLVWVFFPDWSARAMVAVLTLLIAPLLHAIFVRN